MQDSSLRLFWLMFGGVSLLLVVLWTLQGAVVLAKCAADLAFTCVVRGRVGRLCHFLCIPLKDVTIALIWWLGFFKRRVNWRGNVMWIGPESRLYPSRHDTRLVELLPS